VLSLAGRAHQLMKRVGMEPEFTFCGGMSRNEAFVKAIKHELGAPVNVPDGDMGHFNGALGAGLLALDRVRRLQSAREWTNRSHRAVQGVSA
jgi:activator of 2-hydroxyglutaryl-CoA dehydratase